MYYAWNTKILVPLVHNHKWPIYLTGHFAIVYEAIDKYEYEKKDALCCIYIMYIRVVYTYKFCYPVTGQSNYGHRLNTYSKLKNFDQPSSLRMCCVLPTIDLLIINWQTHRASNTCVWLATNSHRYIPSFWYGPSTSTYYISYVISYIE